MLQPKHQITKKSQKFMKFLFQAEMADIEEKQWQS